MQNNKSKSELSSVEKQSSIITQRLDENCDFKPESDDEKHSLREYYKYCVKKANDIIGSLNWSNKVVDAKIIHEHEEKGIWTVSVNMTQQICILNKAQREVSCSAFGIDKSYDLAAYKAYHNAQYHSAICAFQQFGNVFSKRTSRKRNGQTPLITETESKKETKQLTEKNIYSPKKNNKKSNQHEFTSKQPTVDTLVKNKNNSEKQKVLITSDSENIINLSSEDKESSENESKQITESSESDNDSFSLFCNTTNKKMNT